MGFVSCLEDQQKRFESDCHLLQRGVRSGKIDGEKAKKEALRLLGDAKVRWAQMLKYFDELTEPDSVVGETPQELRNRCSALEGEVAKLKQKASKLGDVAGILAMQNQLLQEQLKHERRQRKKLEREFEKMGHEDFGRLVEPFMTKGMFERHAKR
ncbi:hypothetical protein [Marinobacter zhejiangensis]|uniref:Uncharacterized protein n=1 Tax=Marinobacter zhejiangensis TaxID=488535 RepID=A0A1I4NJF8_9GAMM|nr:hypothetical protein [Marinobacter zhejiangensis]SFM15601.1 hypothetical protein SAMN04487963_1440 [Marinobacter zhejiangensis]